MMDEKIKEFPNQSYEEQTENHQDIKESEEYLEYFIQNLKGSDVLDIGCGEGNHCKYFFSKNLQVTGIDISQSFIDFAKAKSPKINFIQMDMQNLSFEKNKFDGLWVCASLLHLKKTKVFDTLKEFNRILKKGGLTFISIKKIPTSLKENSFLEYYSSNEISNLLETTGFKIKNMEEKKGWINIFATK